MAAINSDQKTAAEIFDMLSTPVKSWLVSREAIEKLKELTRIPDLSFTDKFNLAKTINNIDLGLTPLNQLLEILIRDLKIPEAQAKNFALDLAGYRYLPLDELLAVDISSLIKKWGGDPANYPTTKIKAEKITAEELTLRVMKEARLELEPHVNERFNHLLMLRLLGKRTDNELKNVLMRDEKIGGVALSDADALRVITILHLNLANVHVVRNVPQAQTPAVTPTKPTVQTARNPLQAVNPTSIPAPSTSVRPNPDQALPAAKKFLNLPKPELTLNEEIQAIKKDIPAEISIDKFARARKESIDSIIRTARLKFSSPEAQLKFEKIIDSRLRNIRDLRATISLLMQPPDQNGFGMPLQQAASLANVIEAECLAFHKRIETDVKRSAISKISQRHADEKEVSAGKQATNQQDVEERFLKTVKKSTILREKEVLLPETRPTLPNRIQNIRPILSQNSVQPMTATKPQVSDIKVMRTTTGPLGELQNMTIQEFRRLSKDPKEATQKILDKIELIKEEGFEIYREALSAWQQSEPNRFYLELAKAALESGAPVAEQIAKKKSVNEPTLTLEEFQEILKLNARIR